MKILKTIDFVLDRLFAILGAFLFVQAPEFFQQYLQRLGGHVNELKRQIYQIHLLSLQGGKSIKEYINKFLAYKDADVAAQGEFMQNILKRYESLSHGWEALNEASLWTRPFKYLWYGDSEIIAATWKHYTPAVSFSYEGVFYAFLGALIGYGCYHGAKTFLVYIYDKSRSFRFANDDLKER